MNIAIYLYENAEVLDFSGPYEVLSTAKRIAGNDWNIFFVGESDALVSARGGFLVKPHYTFDDHPAIDVLIVVGGIHTEEMKKTKVIEWIKKTDTLTKQTLSVCTGAFLLAEAGLLNGLSVTTHWEDIDDLKVGYPTLQVVDNKRWVCDGKYTTSGGISAGIDMTLHLVSVLPTLTGTTSTLNLGEKTARQMEYTWQKIHC
ncbi:DJ-1/PfpI family protein [Psychromonas sp. RZ22]|uniref:DJ-1/PfpI family protein n=1 Tax=Psychromonas algarum TaxID=2555643 RepID=UPI001067A654|nr:DJ-1/PfpI family protein [Psychromonas sp. RZ22]TEW54598.1 DJ-1/PfpI family protein [Psychromonas sp. RZ22]